MSKWVICTALGVFTQDFLFYTSSPFRREKTLDAQDGQCFRKSPNQSLLPLVTFKYSNSREFLEYTFSMYIQFYSVL